MTTTSDITRVPFSGHRHIDSLLDVGPDWNFLTPAGNVILYTFSVGSGNEAGVTDQQAFSAAQQGYARAAMQYLSRLTGIQFRETTDGAAAQVHLANVDITLSANVAGLCSWFTSYHYDPDTHEVSSYEANVYVYLDNVEFGFQNADLAPGGWGYETLLHELGHMLGLKHSFDTIEGNPHTLPGDQENTRYSLMSYDTQGGPHQQYSPYDVAALMWLYGGDGLSGALGIGAASGARYLVGTPFSDTLAGNGTGAGTGGSDVIDGQGGVDTLHFNASIGSFTIRRGEAASTVAAGDDTDTLFNIERLRFHDASLALDIDGHGGQAYRIYRAAFDRVPDLSGVGFWMSRLDAGASLDEIAGGFIGSAEFAALYGTDPSHAQFVDRLYQHVLHREGDLAGHAFWVNGLAAGATTRAEVLADFSESAENQAQVLGLIGHGFLYTPYG